MDTQASKAMLVHDRNNKLLAIRIALLIKDEATVDQLVRDYRVIVKQLRHLEKREQHRQRVANTNLDPYQGSKLSQAQSPER